jgi:putative heme-binding domain-containing protein
MPNFVTADTAKLIELLGHENLTVRVKATNQLVERGEEVLRAAKAATADTNSATRRAHALWIVERLRGLDETTVEELLKDPDRLVRTHTLRALAERKDLAFARLVLDKLNDPDAFVQRAAVDCLGRHPHPQSRYALWELGKTTPASDTHLIHALRITLRNTCRRFGFPGLNLSREHEWARLIDIAVAVRTDRASHLLETYVSTRTNELDPARIESIIYAAARYCSDDRWKEMTKLAELFKEATPSRHIAALRALHRAEGERGASLPLVVEKQAETLAGKLLEDFDVRRVQQGIALAAEWRLGAMHELLVKIAADRKRGDLRNAAIDASVAVNTVGSVAPLGAILSAGDEPIPLRQKAATALGTIDDKSANEELLKHLPAAPQQVSVAIAAALATRRESAESLLSAIRDGKASPGLLRERSIIERVRAAKVPNLDAEIATLTKNLPEGTDRLLQLITARRAGYDKAAHDVAAGAAVFKKQCAACHRVAGEGAKIGPDLDGIGNRGLDRLLEDVLDPSRNVDQAFRATTIRTADGLNLTGLVLGTEGEVVIIADAQGMQIRLPTADIEDRTISNLSPMPANVAELVAEPDFYHLVAYLLSQAKK